MSKVYNKIVQSNIEPSKNDIWLKDGQMKTFEERIAALESATA